MFQCYIEISTIVFTKSTLSTNGEFVYLLNLLLYRILGIQLHVTSTTPSKSVNFIIVSDLLDQISDIIINSL